MKRFAYWMIWFVVLCTAAAYHFGPGQKPLLLERAATEIARAESAEKIAEAAHAKAMLTVQAKIEAKRLADQTKLPADIDAARVAIDTNDAAWKQTRDAWDLVADAYGAAESLATQAKDVSRARELRVKRSHALIGSGKMFAAAGDLELLVEELDPNLPEDASLTRRVRSEIASAYYQGARAMRLSGSTDAEWRPVSALARQQFRHLAENGSDDGDRARHQRNLEVVLNLEQSTLADLEATPSPGNCKGSCDKPSKNAKPPRRNTKRNSDGGNNIEDIPEEGS